MPDDTVAPPGTDSVVGKSIGMSGHFTLSVEDRGEVAAALGIPSDQLLDRHVTFPLIKTEGDQQVRANAA
jgi:hypothetical protein